MFQPCLWVWFSNGVRFCRAYRSEIVKGISDGHGTMGTTIRLNAADFQKLIETVNKLPSGPKPVPPSQRQFIIGCLRSNQWFQAVYDRGDIPWTE